MIREKLLTLFSNEPHWQDFLHWLEEHGTGKTWYVTRTGCVIADWLQFGGKEVTDISVKYSSVTVFYEDGDMRQIKFSKEMSNFIHQVSRELEHESAWVLSEEYDKEMLLKAMEHIAKRNEFVASLCTSRTE